MDSDDYFDGVEFDSAILNEVDAIVEASLNAAKPKQPEVIHILSDDFDESLAFDESELAKLDVFIEDVYAGRAGPSNATRQTTLTGGVLPRSPPKAQSNAGAGGGKLTRTYSSNAKFGAPAKKTKVWDYTAVAMSKQKRELEKEKGKKRASPESEGEDEDDEEMIEFEQFPAPPSAMNGAPPPMKLKPDLLAVKEWIFPLNRPRRDYQFNIAKRCLLANTLVALPTGLGKTFIAGVVMLNFYRWYPEGKVIFLAPTKPLVSQQIEASHQVCGIPGSDAAELTGNVPRYKRSAAWAEKRVFYMTPQTLFNDLVTESCDPRDIILIVIDEAHKGTGGYAYAQVVRYMMCKNPHFRVLALTATPGNKAEAVQEIVNTLHISHIEIRNENSMDLREYIHKKQVKTHVIEMTPAIMEIHNLMVKIMKKKYDQISRAELLYCQNVANIHPFQCTSARQKLSARKDKNLSWAFTPLKILGALARAIGYLTETSMGMCYNSLKDFEREEKNRARPSKFTSESEFVQLMALLEVQRVRGFEPHPKMKMVQELVLEHLLQHSQSTSGVEEERNPDTPLGGKVMVFIQFRDCVDEVVALLNRQQPMINASPFIGQGADKQGRKGFTQTEQREVLNRFKKGEFNVLVATSIGEEGLDIGEIDRIICYDSSKSAIRMLQRVGRTGRKRTGYVDVLLAKDREERNWDKSKENYEDVQDYIIKGNELELYSDVERLIPDHIREPKCLQMLMPIEEFVREEKKPKGSTLSPRKNTKRKRNDDVNRNVPLGALTGFVTASNLRVKGKETSKVKRQKTWKPLRADGLQDDDDLEIEHGLKMLRESTSPPRKQSTTSTKCKKPAATAGRALELGSRANSSMFQSKLKLQANDIPSSSCKPAKRRETPAPVNIKQDSSPDRPLFARKSSNTRTSTQRDKKAKPSPTDWLLEQDSDVEMIKVSPSPVPKVAPQSSTSPFTTARVLAETISDDENDDDIPIVGSASMRMNAADAPQTSHLTHDADRSVMSSSPPRPARMRASKPCIASSSDTQSSPPSPASPPRKRLEVTSSRPPAHQRPRAKRKLLSVKDNPLFDVEAEHSGDEVSEGDSDVDMVENESDREFLCPLDPTQASPSYNQIAAYRFGLMTQAPQGGPAFTTGPVRTGPFAGGKVGPRRPAPLGSSPNRDEPDEYEMGSFVVDDDDSSDL